MRKNNKYFDIYHPPSIVGPLTILLVMLGSAMQGYANGTVHTFIVASLLFVFGFAIVSLVFFKGGSELRAFLLTYGLCVFVGGMAQSYSLAVFNNPQSTFDAVSFFFPNIISRPPFTPIADMFASMAYALPIVIWQQVYKLTWLLGIDHGPYIGVMFNAFVVAITGSLTVRTARELYGDDVWRLRRVGLLFAFCGVFILFGSVLLRESFTLFLNVLVLWVITRWLVRPSFLNLFSAIIFTGLAVFTMTYLRWETNIILGLVWLLAFLCWYFKEKVDSKRIVILLLSIFAIIITSEIIIGYLNLLQDIQTYGITQYKEFSENISGSDSLGMRLVMNQPLPIRLITGTSMLMLFPIPLWAYFNINSFDYHWIVGYHGIYKLFVAPLAFAGFLSVYRLLKKDRRQGVPFAFLVIYILMTVAAVVVTTMEQRHLAQFMPALIILAALPDTRIREVRTEVLSIAGLWFGGMVLLHVAWFILKGL